MYHIEKKKLSNLSDGIYKCRKILLLEKSGHNIEIPIFICLLLLYNENSNNKT